MTDTLQTALRSLDVPTEATKVGVPVLAYAMRGKITDADIQAVRAAVAGHETVRVLIRIDEFALPKADVFTSGLMNLLEMEAEVMKKLERYAIVGGPDWIGKGAGLVGSLMPFGMKHFTDETAAWAWIGSSATSDEVEDRQQAEQEAAPSLTLLPSHRSDLVAFHIDGHLNASDYETVAIPAVESALRENDAIDLLVRFGTLDGFSLGALKDDASMAQHLDSFRRMALVNAPDWMAALADGAGALAPVEIKTFDEEAPARAWLGGASA